MRIISGKARGTKLYTLNGIETRPTLDRVKESIFNIIQNEIDGAKVLDLFAGSGAIGLEFLSRGAKEAVLCDKSKEAIEVIRKNIKSYNGVGRRFEVKGSYNGALVVDDYAHHPTELKATLSAAKKLKKSTLWCIFQPHTYTRTKTLFDEFTTCFASADELILMDIYAAREKDTGLVSSEELGNAIRKTGLNCINVHSHEEAANYLASKVESGDLVLTVGAGDVVKVGEMLLNK